MAAPAKVEAPDQHSYYRQSGKYLVASGAVLFGPAAGWHFTDVTRRGSTEWQMAHGALSKLLGIGLDQV